MLSLLVSGAVVFGMTEDYLWEGEGSPWVARFVELQGNRSTVATVPKWVARLAGAMPYM